MLRFLSLRHLARHRVRTALTTAGIALGVTSVVAIGLVNSSVTLGMRQVLEQMAGGAQLVISGDRTGVPEEMLEKVALVPGVVHAAPVIRQVVDLRGIDGKPARGRMQIWALDSVDDRATPQTAFRREDLELPDPIRFVSQPRSIVVTEAFARRHGLEDKLDQARIVVSGGQGPVELVVRGILHGDAGRVFGGNLGIMDAYSAQKVFERGARLDEIHVLLRDAATLEETGHVRELLSAAVGPGYDVERPLNRGRQPERIVKSWQAAVGLLSLVTLFVGAFLIYNTVAVSVIERRREIGILRSLGVARARIAALLVVETLLLGVAGAAAGLAAGMAGAHALLRLTTRTMSQLLLDTAVDEVRYTPGTLALGLAAGLALAACSALAPALSAATMPPIEALRAIPSPARQARSRWVSAVLGGLLLLLALVGCLSPASRRSELLASGTLIALLVGFVLSCPVVVPLVMRALVPVLAAFGAVGRLCGAQLRRAPLRSTVTASAIAVGVALVVSSSSVAESFRVSVSSYVARTTVADILVTCSSEIFSPSSLPMSPGVPEALARHPGVAEVQRVRVVDLDVGGRRADLFALDARAWERRVGFPFLRGDRRTAPQALARGEGVAVSENFANSFGLDVGQEVPIRTPRGEVRMRILGVFLDYSTAFGAVVMDRALFDRYWQDDRTDLVHVYLKPSADPRTVRAELEADVGERYDVFVLSTTEVRERVKGLLDDCFLLIRLQDLVAGAVALLGLINTLLISVLERRRELAVLRAIGAGRGQIAASVVLESVALAATGALLGVLLGLGLGWINVDVVSTLHTGWRFEFHVNGALALELLAVLLVAAVAAAWAPALRASRGDIVRGLAEE